MKCVICGGTAVEGRDKCAICYSETMVATGDNRSKQARRRRRE